MGIIIYNNITAIFYLVIYHGLTNQTCHLIGQLHYVGLLLLLFEIIKTLAFN